MKKLLWIGATTCLIGCGVFVGLCMATTLNGLLGEANPRLFLACFIFSIAAGLIAAALWAWRRIRGKPVRIFEWALPLFALLSFSYILFLFLSEEVTDFWTFDPLVAAQRIALWENKPGDSFTYLGTISTTGLRDVRVYSVAREGVVRYFIGVAPRFKFWWALNFDMDRGDYENCENRGTLEKPKK